MSPDVPPGTTAPPDVRQLWLAVLARLRGQTSTAHFETYLRDTAGEEYDAGASVLRVRAGNPFHVPWLEGKFSALLHQTAAEVLGAPVRVEIMQPQRTVPSQRRERPRPADAHLAPLDALLMSAPEAPSAPPSRPIPGSGAQTAQQPDSREGLLGSRLNPRNTFETFVVGKSNQLAHAACQAAADDPQRAYNPLFLYGGVGLGKTHLLHAIGHTALAQRRTVVYVSSETFTNEMIEAIRKNRNDEFRSKYRSADLLLIDDVQFIAGKERTEEEFFHTFNAVHEAGGQIVLSSDRPPRAMTILEDRLRSRFEWGLIADIQPPDYETRVAILRTKLDSTGTSVPPAVVDLIAQKVQSNIRELEGTLNRLLAKARYLQQPISVDMASETLHELAAPGPNGTITAEAVLEAVARYFGVQLSALTGTSRQKTIVVPRQVAMYLLREDAHLSTPDVGRLLNRDHTTVLHGANLVAKDVAQDGPSRAAVRGVRETLAARAPESDDSRRT